MNENILGIDFGTTTSCVSYYNKESNKFTVIRNKNGNDTTPSSIYFNPDSDEILYGEDADYMFKLKSSKKCNYFSNIKRIIGKDIGNLDKEIGSFFSNNIIKNDCFVYCRHDKYIEIKLDELVVHYLTYLKVFALTTIYGTLVDKDNKDNIDNIDNKDNKNNYHLNAIITVPAYYNDLQRNIIKNCFIKCGINVKRVVDEPTAAALYYNYNYIKDEKSEEYQILVFDCGGGTTDISILNVDKNENVYDVIEVVGDNYLGGLDVTKLLVDHIYKECKISKDKLYSYCEKMKCELTYKETTTIYIEEDDFKYTLSRSKFNQICKPFFEKIKKLVDKLDTNTCTITDITHNISNVIFVGGSSKIPYLNDFFSKRFPNAKMCCKYTEVDKFVSLGATLRGVLLYDMLSDNDKFKDTVLIEITHMTLGVETMMLDDVVRRQGIMCPIISKNTIIPVSRTMEFTNSDNLSTIDINVYQGENRLVKDNFLICTCTLENIPLQKSKIIIKVTFTINVDGMLTVEAKVKDNENINVITTKKLSNKDTVDNEENIDEIINKSHFGEDVDSPLSII